jgi:hypothetical protein
MKPRLVKKFIPLKKIISLKSFLLYAQKACHLLLNSITGIYMKKMGILLLIWGINDNKPSYNCLNLK